MCRTFGEAITPRPAAEFGRYDVRRVLTNGPPRVTWRNLIEASSSRA